MDDLIARLEKATGPDRDLDHAIDTALLGEWTYYAPEYTASIDAALTLVPNGYRWLVRKHDGSKTWAGGKGAKSFANVYADEHESPMYEAWTQTPALALCIAALKARQAMANPQRDL